VGPEEYYVYILECSDGSLYTGITNDLTKRLHQHNTGKGSKYCKTRLPVILKYFYKFKNRSEASKEEYRLKKLSRKEKLKLISKGVF